MPKRKSRKPKRSADERLKRLRPLVRRMQAADLSNEFNNESAFLLENITGWSDWFNSARSVMRTAEARSAIHYGVQSLYNALFDEGDSIIGDDRKHILDIGGKIIGHGKKFLTSFYSGGDQKSALATFRRSMRKLERRVKRLDDLVEYSPQERFNELPDVNPARIRDFLVSYLNCAIKEEGYGVPEYVVACAWGALEIALPLSGILKTNMGFLRRSKSRGDRDAKMIPEHNDHLRRGCANRHVVVIEDYVHTGESIGAVMKCVSRFYKPKSLHGASIAAKDPTKDVYRIIQHDDFSLFGLQ